MIKWLVEMYKRFACWIGWHSAPHFDDVHHSPLDPHHFLTFARCRWCGFTGQIDSQGNLF
jgi:hypothetical protein